MHKKAFGIVLSLILMVSLLLGYSLFSRYSPNDDNTEIGVSNLRRFLTRVNEYEGIKLEVTDVNPYGASVILQNWKRSDYRPLSHFFLYVAENNEWEFVEWGEGKGGFYTAGNSLPPYMYKNYLDFEYFFDKELPPGKYRLFQPIAPIGCNVARYPNQIVYIYADFTIK